MRVFMFFFFKQKTAYEMRISDWSSDVCSSDLALGIEESDLVELALRPTDPRYAGSLLCRRQSGSAGRSRGRSGVRHFGLCAGDLLPGIDHGQVAQRDRLRLFDRKSVVSGKSVAVRVVLGGRRIIKKKKKQTIHD